MHLIILKPFLGFAKGDLVTDAETVNAILIEGYEHFVAKISPVLDRKA